MSGDARLPRVSRQSASVSPASTHCLGHHCVGHLLTHTSDRRKFNSFVSGDQSPHSTFGFRHAWTTLRARRSKGTSGKHPITGTVEEDRSQHETAGEGTRQLEATGTERSALTIAVRLQSLPHRIAPPMGW